jgi:hypothetical protein
MTYIKHRNVILSIYGVFWVNLKLGSILIILLYRTRDQQWNNVGCENARENWYKLDVPRLPV